MRYGVFLLLGWVGGFLKKIGKSEEKASLFSKKGMKMIK